MTRSAIRMTPTVSVMTDPQTALSPRRARGGSLGWGRCSTGGRKAEVREPGPLPSASRWAWGLKGQEAEEQNSSVQVSAFPGSPQESGFGVSTAGGGRPRGDGEIPERAVPWPVWLSGLELRPVHQRLWIRSSIRVHAGGRQPISVSLSPFLSLNQ